MTHLSDAEDAEPHIDGYNVWWAGFTMPWGSEWVEAGSACSAAVGKSQSSLSLFTLPRVYVQISAPIIPGGIWGLQSGQRHCHHGLIVCAKD